MIFFPPFNGRWSIFGLLSSKLNLCCDHKEVCVNSWSTESLRTFNHPKDSLGNQRRFLKRRAKIQTSISMHEAFLPLPVDGGVVQLCMLIPSCCRWNYSAFELSEASVLTGRAWVDALSCPDKTLLSGDEFRTSIPSPPPWCSRLPAT